MPKLGERDPIKVRYWQGVLNDWRASGMFAKEYCIKNNIHYNNFVNWKKRLPVEDAELDVDGCPLDTVCFAPVNVIDSAAQAGADGLRTSGMPALEIVLRSGVVLRLSEHCQMKLLSSVISLLGVD